MRIHLQFTLKEMIYVLVVFVDYDSFGYSHTVVPQKILVLFFFLSPSLRVIVKYLVQDLAHKKLLSIY